MRPHVAGTGGREAGIESTEDGASTVVVHAVLIRFPEEQAAALNECWQVVDETVIDFKTRGELLANGLRCGVLVGEMPQIVRARLKELNSPNVGNSMERLGLAAEVISDTQRLHCHAGRRKELSLRPGLNEDIYGAACARGSDPRQHLYESARAARSASDAAGEWRDATEDDTRDPTRRSDRDRTAEPEQDGPSA